MSALTDNAIVADIVVMAMPAGFNLYFALASIPLAFPFAVLLALGKRHKNPLVNRLSRAYIYAFRGSPLFIQLFMFYSLSLSFNLSHWKPMGIDHIMLNPLFLGPLILMLNTAAYTGEIFHGALAAIPRGEVEAAKAVGMTRWQVFRCVTWPNMIRLAWPAYTNEVVFLFHATALVYLSLPVIDNQKDLLNIAGELFERDYNVFLHFGVAAGYFMVLSMAIFYLAGLVYARLNRHLGETRRRKLRFKPNYMR